MMLKKGQGNVIAWVLLVGFAVSLAVLVGRWSLGQSQQATEGIISTGESDIRCENVAISAECSGEDLIVSNKGSLKIVRLNIGGCDSDKEIFCTKSGEEYTGDCLGLNKVSSPISTSGCYDDITLVPMIYIENEVIGCPTKELNVKKCVVQV